MRKLMPLMLVLAGMGVTGCASMGGTNTADSCARFDCDKIAAVNRGSVLGNWQIIWVNLPEKDKTEKAAGT